jgi:chemotaxis methyl-accepting protein methylase
MRVYAIDIDPIMLDRARACAFRSNVITDSGGR